MHGYSSGILLPSPWPCWENERVSQTLFLQFRSTQRFCPSVTLLVCHSSKFQSSTSCSVELPSCLQWKWSLQWTGPCSISKTPLSSEPRPQLCLLLPHCQHPHLPKGVSVFNLISHLSRSLTKVLLFLNFCGFQQDVAKIKGRNSSQRGCNRDSLHSWLPTAQRESAS